MFMITKEERDKRKDLEITIPVEIADNISFEYILFDYERRPISGVIKDVDKLIDMLCKYMTEHPDVPFAICNRAVYHSGDHIVYGDCAYVHYVDYLIEHKRLHFMDLMFR